MSKNTSKLTVDQDYMEKFFKKNILKFFPEVKKIKKLTINRYHSIAREDFIVHYKLFFIDKNNRMISKSLRGTARDDNSKYYNHKVMKLIWENDFSKDKYCVPRPLIYNFYLKQSLYEECPGKTFYQYLDKKKNLKINFKKSARWLAKLHQLKITKGVKTHTLEKEKNQIEKMGKLFSQMTHYYQPFEINYPKILKKVWDLEKKYLKPKNFILIHNDFNPGNIIIGKKKTCCIDFVESCRFHPFADLGTLLAYINSPLSPLVFKHKFSSKTIKVFEKIFIKEYCQNLKLNPKNIKNQIAVFKVRALLIMAMHLTKLSLGWGKDHNYKWIKKPITDYNKKRPIKIYEHFNNPLFIKLILNQAENYLNEIDHI